MEVCNLIKVTAIDDILDQGYSITDGLRRSDYYLLVNDLTEGTRPYYLDTKEDWLLDEHKKPFALLTKEVL